MQPELGIGAIAPGGVMLLNERTINALGLTEADLAPVVRQEREEMGRRLHRYRGDRLPDVEGRAVILVDDGLATGVTAAAAIRAVRETATALAGGRGGRLRLHSGAVHGGRALVWGFRTDERRRGDRAAGGGRGHVTRNELDER